MGIKNIFLKAVRKFSRYVKNDGYNAIFVIFQNHGMTLMRRIFYKVIFGWDVRSSGGGAYIRGSRHMQVGENFCFKADLWLEAVTDFQEQQFAPQILIGSNLSAGNSLHIAATNYVCIGNNVLIGSKVLITDHLHGLYRGENPSHPDSFPGCRPLTTNGTVTIGDNVFIGDNVCILPGVSIGSGSVVAANSVVTGHVPEHAIVAGIPAVVVKKFIEMENKWKRV